MAGVPMVCMKRSRIHGNEIGETGPLGEFGGVACSILVRSPYAQ